MPERGHHFLDVTAELCPMSFVRAKLMMEAMRPGETGIVRVMAGEALRHIPQSLRDHGCLIVSVTACDASVSDAMGPDASVSDAMGPHDICFRRALRQGVSNEESR